MLDKTALLVDIVSTLAHSLEKPVTCKIRLLPKLEDTLALCHALVNAGCSLLTVHGRTKEQNKHLVGTCDWAAIKVIKDAMPVPVFANGGVADLDDVLRCLAETGVDGVMSSEALLENPGLFSRNIDSVTGREATQIDLAEQYLEYVEKYPLDRLKVVRAHIFKFLFTGVQAHHDLREKLVTAGYQGIKEVVAEMRQRAAVDPSLGGRSWYWRHWENGGKKWGVMGNCGKEGAAAGKGETCGGGREEERCDGEQGDAMACMFGGEEEEGE